MPFSDPSNKLVSPLDRLRIMCPLEELAGDTGDGVGRGSVADMGDRATTVVEVRGDFGVTPTFASEYSV